jgi:DNA polymerase IV (DinB-like DNA polymerase)
MDYFFAQVEERENPQFKGKPVVVGADPKGGRGRGVVSTANYAARKYGIHSALPISKAFELCPEAIFLPVNMELYQKVSERIMEILEKYSEKIEVTSLDEAYLDLSDIFDGREKDGIRKSWEKAENLAKKLKKEIFQKEKLTCTIGIGPNKLIAKMATNKAKPNGLLIIRPSQVKSFLEPLDIEKLPGIGPKTAERLREIGVNKIKELKKLSKAKLKNIFGVVGERIYERARGIDETPVTSEEIIKSIGREHTFEKDTRDSGIIFEVFEKIIEDLHQELIDNNLSFRTITVICRFQGFETHTKSKTLKDFTQDLEVLKKEAKRLFLKFLVENPKLVRLIGVRVSGFWG